MKPPNPSLSPRKTEPMPSSSATIIAEEVLANGHAIEKRVLAKVVQDVDVIKQTLSRWADFQEQQFKFQEFVVEKLTAIEDQLPAAFISRVGVRITVGVLIALIIAWLNLK